MRSEHEYQVYISKCKDFFNLMLSSQQWSGITKVSLNRWLNNLEPYSITEQYFFYKILANLIYYSEQDIQDLLCQGLKWDIHRNLILKKQISADFMLSKQAIRTIISTETIGTRYSPLLDSDKPYESGNYLLRILVQQSIITPSQGNYVQKHVDSYIEGQTFKRLIIIDDCVGSGKQFYDFWKCETVVINGKPILLRKWCSDNNIKPMYFFLFGYKSTLHFLHEKLQDIDLYCMKILPDEMRVFSETSYIWDSEELQEAQKTLEPILAEFNIPLHGYSDLDFNLVMHKTIPDWSLPMLWKNRDGWSCLLRRKNSDV